MDMAEGDAAEETRRVRGRRGFRWLLVVLLTGLGIAIAVAVVADPPVRGLALASDVPRGCAPEIPEHEPSTVRDSSSEAVIPHLTSGREAATVHVVDSGDNPLEGVTIGVVLRFGDGPGPRQEFVSDRAGVIVVPDSLGLAADLYAPSGYVLHSAIHLREYDASTLATANVVLTGGLKVRLYQIVRIRWEVSYADGQRYQGAVAVTTAPTQHRFNLEVSADTNPEYAWPVDQSEVLTATAYSRRAGFTDARSVEVRPVRDPAGEPHLFVCALILPAGDADLGNIEIDLSSYGPDRTFRVAAKMLGGGPPPRSGQPLSIGEDRLEGGQRHCTRTLLPGEYSVIIVDGDASESLRPYIDTVFGIRHEAVVTVRAGETTLISVPVGIETGSLSVRVVDSVGKPISGAVVTLAGRDGADTISWFALERWTPGSARVGVKPMSMTDADGNTVLHGLACVAQELAVHAKGYQSARLAVTPTPLRVEPAGEVVLRPAAGQIAITIDHGDLDAAELPRMHVFVLRVSGSPALPKQEVMGTSHVIEGLPDDTYTVVVMVGAQWLVTRAQSVQVGPDMREFELVFELRRR